MNEGWIWPRTCTINAFYSSRTKTIFWTKATPISLCFVWQMMQCNKDNSTLSLPLYQPITAKTQLFSCGRNGVMTLWTGFLSSLTPRILIWAVYFFMIDHGFLCLYHSNQREKQDVWAIVLVLPSCPALFWSSNVSYGPIFRGVGARRALIKNSAYK